VPGCVPYRRQLREFGNAPHQRHQACRGIQPGAGAAVAVDAEELQGPRRVGQGAKPQAAEPKVAGGEALRVVADNDLSVVDATAQLDRDAGGLADRVGQRDVFAGQDQPGVHADADLHAVRRFAQERQGRSHRTYGAVFMRSRIAEISQQAAPVHGNDKAGEAFDACDTSGAR
jgi:hypothetical protein